MDEVRQHDEQEAKCAVLANRLPAQAPEGVPVLQQAYKNDSDDDNGIDPTPILTDDKSDHGITIPEVNGNVEQAELPIPRVEPD